MRIPHAAALLLPFFACRGQTPNYTANYKAQFANYLATTCQSAPPVIHVACQGDLFITETSHPTIDCSQAPLKDENGWNFIECTNSCQGTECLDAWQADPDVTPLHDISYGEIVFECSGDDIKNVDAYTSQEGGDVGVCTEDEALNIRIARLGVQCGDEYDFDDFYFECASNGVALNTAQYIYSDDSQACVSGFVCQVDPVTKMCDDIFGRIQVKADHEEFQKSCVQAKPGAPVIPEASSPDVPEVDATFKATFRAGWLFRFYGDMFGLDCTLSQTVRIQCVEGEFEPIKKELEINCGNLDSSSITCNGQTMNDFSELEFVRPYFFCYFLSQQYSTLELHSIRSLPGSNGNVSRRQCQLQFSTDTAFVLPSRAAQHSMRWRRHFRDCGCRQICRVRGKVEPIRQIKRRWQFWEPLDVCRRCGSPL